MDRELLIRDSTKENEDFEDHPVVKMRQRPWLRAFSWVLNALFAICLVVLLLVKTKETAYRHQEVYSPAQQAVEYQTTVFTSNFLGKKTKYQGPPTEEVDVLWDELYNAQGISRIDKQSAMQLPNKTAAIPGDPGFYIVGLNVFHEINCLNNLRKLIWPEYYHFLEGDNDPDEPMSRVDHLGKETTAFVSPDPGTLMLLSDHCVDFLRQSLMCHSDISTIYWQWDEKRQRNFAHADTTHTCRNFDKIRAWAVEHELAEDFDSGVHISD